VVRDGMTSRSGIMQIFYEIADFRFQDADLFQNAEFYEPADSVSHLQSIGNLKS